MLTLIENTKKNFPSAEIDKLVSFFDDLLDVNKSLEDTCNPILWNKVKEIWAALDKSKPSIEVQTAVILCQCRETNVNVRIPLWVNLNISTLTIIALILLLKCLSIKNTPKSITKFK